MATKDITDIQVLLAYEKAAETVGGQRLYPYDILMQETGQPEKVCFRAMERASDRDLVECGVSLRTGWLTDKGKQLLEEWRRGQKTDSTERHGD